MSASPYGRTAQASLLPHLQQFDKSVADLTEAIHPVAHSRCGRLLQRSRLQPARSGKLRQIRGGFRRGHPARSENGPGLFQPRRELDDSERIRQGHGRLHKAIAIDPKMVYAYDGRGYVWSKRGHYDRRCRTGTNRRACALDEPGSYHNKARLYASCMSLGHRDGKMALANAKKACELDHYEEWRTRRPGGRVCRARPVRESRRVAEKGNRHEQAARGARPCRARGRLKLLEAGMPFRDPEIPEQAEEEGS